MVTALLAGLILGSQAWDGVMNGVWASTDGEVFVFCGKHGTFIKNSDFGWVEFDRLNPQGQSWYIWSTGPVAQFSQTSLASRKDRSLVHAGSWFLNPTNPRTWGWMKIATTPNPRRLNFTMQDPDDTLVTRGSLDYITEVANAYVDGTYSGPNGVVANIALGTGGQLTGKFQFAGMTAQLKGYYGTLNSDEFHPVYARQKKKERVPAAAGYLEIVNNTSGATVGRGAIFWDGGSKTIDSLKVNKPVPADKLLLRFTLMDKSQLPNGMTVKLTRKEES